MKLRIAMVVFTLAVMVGVVAAGAHEKPISTAAIANRCCDGGDPEQPIIPNSIPSPLPEPQPQPQPTPAPSAIR
jgi:hypothetical protein